MEGKYSRFLMFVATVQIEFLRNRAEGIVRTVIESWLHAGIHFVTFMHPRGSIAVELRPVEQKGNDLVVACHEGLQYHPEGDHLPCWRLRQRKRLNKYFVHEKISLVDRFLGVIPRGKPQGDRKKKQTVTTVRSKATQAAADVFRLNLSIVNSRRWVYSMASSFRRSVLAHRL